MDFCNLKTISVNGDADSGIFGYATDSDHSCGSSSSEDDNSLTNSDSDSSSPSRSGEFPQNAFVFNGQPVLSSPKNFVAVERKQLNLLSSSNKAKEHFIRISRRKKLAQEEADVMQYFEKLIDGQNEPVDFSINADTGKPEWLDEVKFKRGQEFATKHFFCINYAEMVSLFILFAQKSSLGPLIFTHKSDSPFTAFRRYLNTVSKLLTWYSDDIWNDNRSQGKKNLSIVRAMHKSVYTNLTNCPSEDLVKRTTLGDPATTALWCPLIDVLVRDFRNAIPCPPWNHCLDKNIATTVWVNQADMSITQFGFVGLAVTYPQAFGIHLATIEDLDAFLHMWRGLGYLLGIKDEYNYCSGGLKSVQERTRFLLDVIVKPAFRDVTCDWEHMCRCLTAGLSYYLPKVTFEASLLYLCHVVDIEMPRLRQKISFLDYLMFQLHRFVFYIMKIPGVLSWFNSRLHLIIRKVQAAPPELLENWKKKEFPYTKQPGKCPISSFSPTFDSE